MRIRLYLLLLSAGLLGLLGAPAIAGAATTLGSVTPQTSSSFGTCFTGSGTTPDALVQMNDSASTPYTVPDGAWTLTGWSTNTTGSQDVAGQPLTLLVLAPESGGAYSVVGTDSETLPTPLPIGGVATFTPATPIAVTGGDVLGIYSTAPTSFPDCYWDGPGVPASDVILALTATSGTPQPGQTLTPDGPGGESPPGFELNLAATLSGLEDASVTAAAGPSKATVGYPALLSSTVANNGPNSQPITFTDTVPSGLAITAAAAGSGTCTTAGQTVTCTLNLASGQSAPVNIVVTPGAAQSYVNSVSVTPSGTTDPNMANNSATATLTVGPAPTVRACVVPRLTGTPLAVARRVLGLLGCKAGKVRRVHRRTARGAVIRTSPGSGRYAAGRRIGITVSSGPAPKKHNKHKKHSLVARHARLNFRR